MIPHRYQGISKRVLKVKKSDTSASLYWVQLSSAGKGVLRYIKSRQSRQSQRTAYIDYLQQGGDNIYPEVTRTRIKLTTSENGRGTTENW